MCQMLYSCVGKTKHLNAKHATFWWDPVWQVSGVTVWLCLIASHYCLWDEDRITCISPMIVLLPESVLNVSSEAYVWIYVASDYVRILK